MNNAHLNLARKWRSQSFDQIVGQPLSIRMLKNSLYLENFFPVYLFSGQRGCGKTTTARVFAAAINCQKLKEFQQSPKTQAVPCLTCDSCQAMLAMRHPDFIEIDAASHTGVDNVRDIIDAASLLPVMGRKKIYLIDEVHMLSKSAFNAFLKILEEPPVSALFILATTDVDKVIDTVRSRCFQLFFGPVEAQNLFDHLVAVCKAERINCDDAGLQLIIKETQGSVRDALNLLEQVRFASSVVTKTAVQQVLGHIDDDRLVHLLQILLFSGPKDLMLFIQSNKLEKFSAEYIWQRITQLCRAALWLKYGCEPENQHDALPALKKIVRNCSTKKLNDLLDTFYMHELVFAKTTAQHALLEMILLKACQKNGQDDNSGASSLAGTGATDQPEALSDQYEELDSENEDDQSEEQEDDQSSTVAWQRFIHNVSSLQDNLLNSVFSQATFGSFDPATKKVTALFAKELGFFKDWVEQAAALWKPLLDKEFGAGVGYAWEFNVNSVRPIGVSAPKQSAPVHADTFKTQPPVKAQQVAPKIEKKPYVQEGGPRFYGTPKKAFPAKPVGTVIDVSDVTIYKKANILLQFFPGTIREIPEGIHGQKS